MQVGVTSAGHMWLYRLSLNVRQQNGGGFKRYIRLLALSVEQLLLQLLNKHLAAASQQHHFSSARRSGSRGQQGSGDRQRIISGIYEDRLCVSRYAGEVHNVPTSICLCCLHSAIGLARPGCMCNLSAALFCLSEIESGSQADDEDANFAIGHN